MTNKKTKTSLKASTREKGLKRVRQQVKDAKSKATKLGPFRLSHDKEQNVIVGGRRVEAREKKMQIKIMGE